MSQRAARDPKRDAALAELGATYSTEQLVSGKTEHYRCTITSTETGNVLAVAEAHDDDASDPEREDLGQTVDIAIHRAINKAKENQ